MFETRIKIYANDNKDRQWYIGKLKWITMRMQKYWHRKWNTYILCIYAVRSYLRTATKSNRVTEILIFCVSNKIKKNYFLLILVMESYILYTYEIIRNELNAEWANNKF